MSDVPPVHRTKSEHLKCLQLRSEYLKQLIALRELNGKPSGYEKQQAHAIESALREIKEWRTMFHKGELGD